MASREELLRSIRPDMRLDKDFFLRVYGYEITWPGFAEVALQRLEILGCNRARSYYSCVVAEYEQRQEKSIKPVAAEYAKRLKEKWEQKRGEQQRTEKLNNMSTKALLLRKKELLLMRRSLT